MECSSKDKLHTLAIDFRKEWSDFIVFGHQPQSTNLVGTWRFMCYLHHVLVDTLLTTVNLLKYHNVFILYVSVFSIAF